MTRLVAAATRPCFTALLACVLLVLPATASASAIPGQYIVVLRDAADPGAAESDARSLGATILARYRHALNGYAARVPDASLPALRSDSRVASVTPDMEVEAADPRAVSPVPAPQGQLLPTGVDRIDADLSSTLAGDGTGSVQEPMAILDSGIDRDHPDLNVVGGSNCDPKARGFDDENGHGSYVAGVAAARDNGLGTVGVAPGAPLYAVRVLDKASRGSSSGVLCGIDWVTANAARLGIRVANMSVAAPAFDAGASCETTRDPVSQALCNSIEAGTAYTVASGNSTADLGGFFPAHLDVVIAATAIWDNDGLSGGLGTQIPIKGFEFCADDDDVAAFFSNFTTVGSGDTGHVIAAPGTCIISTDRDGGYGIANGTSGAAPHVAGVVALCLTSGDCRGGPARITERLLRDAAREPTSYGYRGDPTRPITIGGVTRYFGYLIRAASY